ncbi:MAG: heavy-metal-associated domain-containing protein [Arcobacteraceae bacterium]|nr:heavy-metal-associated domain-containing protein [Arcobacteraceae bacterium]MDY0327360.1 heavy-metal-associated domain-containing protein [Arcobacteraceae bacterium]
MSLQSFEVENVKCGGCASTLKKSLKDEFGEVEVNLDTMPRIITLDIDDTKIDTLKLRLRKLGYPLVTDELSTMQNLQTKAKSFVSCAIGKMDS